MTALLQDAASSPTKATRVSEREAIKDEFRAV